MTKNKRREPGGRHPDFLTAFEQRRLAQHAHEFESRKGIRALLRLENILYTQLEKNLPAHLHPVLVRYSDTINKIVDRQEIFFYRKGYVDGSILYCGFQESISDLIVQKSKTYIRN